MGVHARAAAVGVTIAVALTSLGLISPTESYRAPSVDTSRGAVVSPSWLRLLGGIGADSANSAATGYDFNVYVTGTTSSASFDGLATQGGSDLFLVKYNGRGERLWSRLLGGPGNEAGHGVATASDGSVYVVGSTTTTSLEGQTNVGANDIMVAKYSGNGRLRWVRLLGGPQDDYGYDVAAWGNAVYVTGSEPAYLTGDADPDIVLVKYRARGGFEWIRTQGGDGWDAGYGVMVGGNGSIYVTGHTYSPEFEGKVTDGLDDIVLTRYRPNGTPAWTRLLGTEQREFAYDIAAWGNAVYIVGFSGDPFDDDSFDLLLASYSTTGGRQWVRKLGGAKYDDGRGVTIGPDGSIYVTGLAESPSVGGVVGAGGQEILLAKYRANGARRWVRLLGADGDEFGSGITAGKRGVFVVGSSDSPLIEGQTNAGSFDAVIAGYR